MFASVLCDISAEQDEGGALGLVVRLVRTGKKKQEERAR